VQRLDATAHNFWETGVGTDFSHCYSSVLQSFGGRAGGKYFNSGFSQNFSKLEQSRFVIDTY
jgi:hypothetical protein